MDKKEHDKITAFDILFTTNHIQMLKIVMPYLDSPMQKNLAIYIKYLELQYTISVSRYPSPELCGCSAGKEDFDVQKMCSEVLPYCTNEEKQKIEHIAGLFHSMEMYKEMSKTFELMKDFFPDNAGDPSNNGGASDTFLTDMLMNMLSPEQKTMFEMFGGNNNGSKPMDE